MNSKETGAISQERLERHIEVRRRRLGCHEDTRLTGDRAIDTGQPDKAGLIYEETVKRAGVASSNRFATRTRSVVERWVREEKISQETGDWFLDLCYLGCAGEARIETVAATSRLKLAADREGKSRWAGRAKGANQKHISWRETLERINETLHKTPCLWTIMIPIDRAVILQAMGEKEEAVESFQLSFSEAMKIFNEAEDLVLKLAAASDGGVARVRHAKLLEEMNIDPKTIFPIFKEGRDLVHWAGRENKNFERSRVIEMWYTQHLWATRNYKAFISTLPTWIWLACNHDGTRKMIKDRLKQIWQKGEEKIFGFQYVQG